MHGGRDRQPAIGVSAQARQQRDGATHRGSPIKMVKRPLLAGASVTVLVAGGLLAAVPAAHAADPDPTPLACTVAAVQQAVATGGEYVFNCTDTIQNPLDVDGVGEPFVVPSGVQVSLARPAGASKLEFGGSGSRMFNVASGGTLRLENVTLEGGLSGEDDLHGASSYPAAERASNGADGVNVGVNGMAGTGQNGTNGDSGSPGKHGGDGAGGAIYNQGTVVLDDVMFEDNTAKGGNGGNGGDGQHGGGGGSGATGQGGQGGNGGNGGQPGGPGGNAVGGSIYNTAGAVFWGNDLGFRDDSVWGGAGGDGGNGSYGGNGGQAGTDSPCPPDGGSGGNAGSGPGGTPGGTAFGGDIFNAGTMYIGGDSSFGNNSVDGGGGGSAGSIWAAGGGGGARYPVDGTTCPDWSGGDVGQNGEAGNGAHGGQAAGGAIFNAVGATLTLAGTPKFAFSGEIAVYGGAGGNGGDASNSKGGDGGTGGDGANADGAAVANASSNPVSLSAAATCEYAGNTSCSGAAYACYATTAGTAGGGGHGGGLTGDAGQTGLDCADYFTGDTTSIADTTTQASPWPDAWFTAGGGQAPIVLPGTPSVTGTAKVGDTLTAHTGSWLASGPLVYGYVWKANGTAISGQTGTTLRLVAADLGKKISVTVTGTDAPTSQSATSKATSAVGKGALTAVVPKITGTTKVGHKLKVTPGSWKPAGVKRAYQWFAKGKKIAGATKSTLTLKAAQAGKKITVEVTGTLTGYTSVTKTSKATAKVKA